MAYKLKVLFRFLKILLQRYKKRKQSKAIIKEAQYQSTTMSFLVEESIAILDQENEQIEGVDFELLEEKLVDNTTKKDLQETLIGIDSTNAIKRRSFDLVAFKESIRVLNSKLFNVKLRIRNFKHPIEIKNQTDDILLEATSIANEIISKSPRLKPKTIQSFDDENTRFSTFLSKLGLAETHERRQLRSRDKIQHFLSKAEQYTKIKNFLQARRSLNEAELIIRSSKIADYSKKLAKIKERLVREEEQENRRLLAEQQRKLREQEEERKRLEVERLKSEQERKLAEAAAEKRRTQEAENARQQEQERLKAELAKALAAKEAENAEKLRREQIKLKEQARKEAEERKREQDKLLDYTQKLLLEQQKENEKKEQLNQLLDYKYNWQSFSKILKDNNINSLYHFTDKANIASIKKNGGLFSWSYCERNNINIPFAGGNLLSRQLDSRYGLQDYVRTSFTSNHPMLYVAQNDGRINEPVILHISIEVCYFENSMFSDRNAAKTGCHYGGDVEDLLRVKFNCVKRRDYFKMSAEEKSFYQAEVLVKTWIPLKYITNIDKV